VIDLLDQVLKSVSLDNIGKLKDGLADTYPVMVHIFFTPLFVYLDDFRREV